MADDEGSERAAATEVARQAADYAQGSDLGWTVAALEARREAILASWLAATAEQPFHRGRGGGAVADHIPELFDALLALLGRAAPSWLDPGAPLDDEAVRAAAEAHARMRAAQGLEPADISTEFRLLRQELWRALREELSARAPIGDAVGAQILLNDALDGAMAVGLAALTARVEQVREEFLATTVHEVRRPLTVIRGSAALSRRLLARPEPNREQIDTLLSRVEAATEGMNGLLTTLVELSQAALGGITLRPAPGDLAAIIAETVAHLGPEAARVEVRVWPELDTTGVWDAERMAQVFSNLIANALKYSEPPSPVGVIVEGDAVSLTCLIVDRGIGIPAEDLPRLFTRYGRASNAVSGGIEGVGLGLYLCRLLVEAHGGTIGATSPGPGQGTTVQVTLPRSTPPPR